MNTMRLVRAAGAVAVIASALLVGSCNSDSVGPDRQVSVARVSFPSPSDSVLVGDSIALTLTVEDANGIPVTRAATWSSSDPTLATVSATGEVTAHDGGVVTITAVVDGLAATKRVYLLERVMAVAIQTDTTKDTLLIRDTLWLQVQLHDAHGAAVQRRVTWISSDTGIATVGVTEAPPPSVSRGPSAAVAPVASGSIVGGSRAFVLAVGPGTVVITATSEGLADSTTLTVGEPVASVELSLANAAVGLDKPLQLQARLRDRYQRQLHRQIAWTSSDPGVATVNGAGMVMGHGLGTCTITATSEGVSASATVAVVTPASAFTAAPPNISLAVGDTMRLTASVTDASGAPLARSPVWTSGDTAIATVNADALVTAVGPGATTITGEIDGLTARVNVAVILPGPTVVVQPADIMVLVGGTVDFTAQALEPSGQRSGDQTITWSSSDPAVVEIDANGHAVGRAEGRVSIIATGRQARGTAMMSVTTAPVTTITIDPTTDSLLIGDTIRLVGTAHDAGGRVMAGIRFGWSSDHEAIATVDAAGLLTAMGAGTAVVQATYGEHAGTATITVFEHPSSVVINPPQAQVRMGDRMSLKATLLDPGGNPQGGSVTYTSSDPSIATVSPSGTVTGVAEGTVTITATSGEKSGTATVVVSGQRPTVDEGLGNNLSVPVVFSEGLGLAGLPVTVGGAPSYVNTGLRPTSAEQVLVGALPFFYVGNRPDQGSFYLQKTLNTWQAEWRDGTATGLQHASATWGDNIVSRSFKTSAPIRVEVSLNDLTSGALAGYNMHVISGSGSTEVQGTDGSTASMTPTIFSVVPHLVVSKLDTSGGNTVGDPVVDKRVIDAIGAEEGPGRFGAEVNVSGKVVYGYNLRVTEAGWYRVAFILDNSASNGTVGASRNVTMDALTNSTAEEPSEGSGSGSTGPKPVPQLSGDGSTTWVDIYVAPGSGSGEGGGGGETGGDTGTGNNLSVPLTFAEGIGLGGQPVTVAGERDQAGTGLRPTGGTEPNVSALPYFPTSYNTSNCSLGGTPYFCQGGAPVWEAEWYDASGQATREAQVAWGDNLLTNHFNTHANVHVEVSLTDLTTPAMAGFRMAVVSGEGASELQGTDGTTALMSPMVYTRGARLKVELLDSATHTPVYTVFDQGLWQAGDGPGQFMTEVSMGGTLVYTYNLLVQQVTVPESAGHKYGWYRFTFSIDGSGPVTPNVRMTQLAAGSEEGGTEGGGSGSGSGGSGSGGIPSKNVPTLNVGAQSTSIDIWIAKGGGGSGGQTE
jgi:uncharacterized protein YjdB